MPHSARGSGRGRRPGSNAVRADRCPGALLVTAATVGGWERFTGSAEDPDESSGGQTKPRSTHLPPSSLSVRDQVMERARTAIAAATEPVLLGGSCRGCRGSSDIGAVRRAPREGRGMAEAQGTELEALRAPIAHLAFLDRIEDARERPELLA